MQQSICCSIDLFIMLSVAGLLANPQGFAVDLVFSTAIKVSQAAIANSHKFSVWTRDFAT